MAAAYKIKLVLLFSITFILIVTSITVAVMLSICCINDGWRILGKFQYAEQPDFYKNGAVATDHVYCSRIGRDILKEGGNAIDAAIGALFCLGVVNMHSSGIGGGGGMLIYFPKNNQTIDSKIKENTAESRDKVVKKNVDEYDVKFFDYRETAPLDIEKYLVNRTKTFSTGPQSVAVPSQVHGMYKVWKEHGKLNWERLLAPSIKLAEEGMPFHRRLHEAAGYMLPMLKLDPGMRQLLMNDPTGKAELMARDSILKNPQLAQTLKTIARDPMSFYEGELADLIVQDIQTSGGYITKDDLKKCKTIVSEPVKFTFNSLPDLHFFGGPPPFSGAIVGYILRILDTFNLSEKNLIDKVQIPSHLYHLIVEAMKFGFGERAFLSDPNFTNKTKLNEKIKEILSFEHAQTIKNRLSSSNTTHDISFYSKHPTLISNHGTTHVSVIGPDGIAVSATDSINIWFGSGFRSEKTGIIYNNHMDDFSVPNHTNAYNLPPTEENFIQPGKRPTSSISPIFLIKDDKFYMPIGASGGTRIISSLASVIFYHCFLNDSLENAILRARLHHQLVPNQVVVDGKFPVTDQVIKDLKHIYNHNISQTFVPEYSSVQAVEKDTTANKTRILHAMSDPRKYGQAMGY